MDAVEFAPDGVEAVEGGVAPARRGLWLVRCRCEVDAGEVAGHHADGAFYVVEQDDLGVSAFDHYLDALVVTVVCEVSGDAIEHFEKWLGWFPGEADAP